VSASTERGGAAPIAPRPAPLGPERRGERPSRPGWGLREQRGDIQGLRGVAVLLVIGVHAAGFPRSGFIGVDIFFVISGFVIASRLLGEAEGTGSISIPRFYARRFQRIAPAALLTLGAVVAAASLLPGVRRASVLVDALWAALGVGNIRMILMPGEREGGFLQVSPIGHFWSLAVEEQFYLLLPLGLVLAWRLGARRGAARRWVLGAGVTGSGAAFALAVGDVALQGDAAYYSTTGRAWELGAGVAVAILAPRFRALGTGARSALGFGGLIALEIAAVGWLQQAYPLPAGLLPVGGAAALIIAGTGGTSVVTRAFSHGWLRWIGDRSYSLYLWHFPILVFMLVVQPTGRWDVIAESLVLTLLVASLSYRFVERPASAMFRHDAAAGAGPSGSRRMGGRPTAGTTPPTGPAADRRSASPVVGLDGSGGSASVPVVGLEPTSPLGQSILSAPRLPFRHTGPLDAPAGSDPTTD
jgi:peptidoglycan/LPS O-acetylase OafA/YrhL